MIESELQPAAPLPPRRPPFQFTLRTLLLLFVVLGSSLAVLRPLVMAVGENPRHLRCWSNLQYISLALNSYASTYGHFPPACIADKDGKAMHSWRVLILPFLDESAVYKAYDFTEPWDGPKNKKLLASRPVYFACPDDPAHDPETRDGRATSPWWERTPPGQARSRLGAAT